MPSFAIVSKLVAAFHKKENLKERAVKNQLPHTLCSLGLFVQDRRLSPSLSGIVSAVFANCRCKSIFSKTVLSLGRRKAGCSIYRHPRADLRICTVSNHTSYPVCRNNRSRLASYVRVFCRGHRL